MRCSDAVQRRFVTVVCGVICISPGLSHAEDARELKSFGKAYRTMSNDRRGPILFSEKNEHLQDQLVIRSAEELVTRSRRPKDSKDRVVQREMETELAKLLGVEAIDWDSQMVIGVMKGSRTERKVTSTSFHIKGDTLTVTW